MSTLLIDQTNQEFAAAPGSADGTLVGRNASTPIGFCGVTPIVRPSLSGTTATAQQVANALIALGLATGTA